MLIEADGRRRVLQWLRENAAAVTRLKCWGSDLVQLPAILPSVTRVRIGASRLTLLPELPLAEHVTIWNCSGLTELPELPAGLNVNITDCANIILQSEKVGKWGDRFFLIKARGHWRVFVGWYVFTIAEARLRWGIGTNPYNPKGQPDPLAIVEGLVEKLARLYPDERPHDFVELQGRELFGQTHVADPARAKNLDDLAEAWRGFSRAING